MPASTSMLSSSHPPQAARILGAANRHPGVLAWIVCLLAALPVAMLAWDALAGELGANPLERILRTPARWALILLLVVLCATPLRQILAYAATRSALRVGRRPADWNWLIQLRRPLGLASFFYASAHAALYLSLDLGFNWQELANDLRTKPYIVAGLAAILLLVPLAITSTDGWKRRLKRNWTRLHYLVYPAALLAVLHFVWLSKPGVSDPYIYSVFLAVLLGYRIAARNLRMQELGDTTGAYTGKPVDVKMPGNFPERRFGAGHPVLSTNPESSLQS